MSHHRTTAGTRPITTLNPRELSGSAEFYYHQYRAAEEKMHDAAKTVIAGQADSLRNLRTLQKQRDQAYDTMLQFLSEITRRIKEEGKSIPASPRQTEGVIEYLHERQRRRELAAAKKSQ